MALRKRNRRPEKFIPPKLMLTAMMDMFTIILIFLLFSFSDSPENIKLDNDLALPHSTAEQGYQKTIKLVLSKKELRLNDEVLATVLDRQITGLLPGDLKSSVLFHKLRATLELQTDVQVHGPPETNDSRQAPHLLFICDKSHSFKTINSIIKTAALAGYPNFQFAVLEE